MHLGVATIVVGVVVLACGAVHGQAQQGPPPPSPIPIRQAPEPPPPPWAKRGLTTSVGLGHGYGWLGLQARFDFPLRWWLHVSPFIGAGTSGGLNRKQLAGATGVSVGIGMRHRLAVDLALAPIGFQQLNLHGTVVDERAMYGPVVGGGYEMFTASGFMGRLVAGYGFPWWTRGSSDLHSGTLTISFGLGHRTW